MRAGGTRMKGGKVFQGGKGVKVATHVAEVLVRRRLRACGRDGRPPLPPPLNILRNGRKWPERTAVRHWYFAQETPLPTIPVQSDIVQLL